MKTATDLFWNRHAVRETVFVNKEESMKFLDWRFSMYPLFKEYLGLWGNRQDEIVVDYGCGPGHDVVGLSEFSGAKKVYGIDISDLAIGLAKKRLALHHISEEKAELIKINDTEPFIPLESNSVDSIYSQGVIHHSLNYCFILSELYRILKPGKEARIMVYNKDSLWYHYYIGCELLMTLKKFNGKTAEEIAHTTTDTDDTPVAIFFSPGHFLSVCRKIGFTAEFLGGYFNEYDLMYFNKYGIAIKNNPKLAKEHRDFISEVQADNDRTTCFGDRKYHWAKYRGKYCGLGGSFLLKK